MAKRRRKRDDRKLSKHERRRRSESRSRTRSDDDEDYEPSQTRRLEAARARTRRNDITVISIAVIFIFSIIGGYFIYYTYFQSDNGDETGGNPTPSSNLYKVPSFSKSDPNNPVAILEVQGYGVVVIELYQFIAPRTVDNFMTYARSGFYDGLIFHRVIDGFMIQGGGFNTDLSKKETPFPPLRLEVDPSLRHVDGAIAMARTSDPNSATSQFFIDDGPQPDLEPGGVDQYGYAVFGQVVSGLDIVRDISAVNTGIEKTPEGQDMQDVPVNDVIIKRIYEYLA
jgi:cyclophilin family peptidyl-prolyl cis-trans isomerase